MNRLKKQLKSEAGRQLSECHCEAITECNRRSNPIKHENNEIATLHTVARNDTISFAQQTVTLSPRPLRLCRANRLSIDLREVRVRERGKAAFTLAEVLITLGIIGVVAALTMPSLISNHNKHVAETQLKKFYTNINQAIKLSEVDNGPAETWNIPDTVGNIEDAENFYNQYLAKYLKTIGTDTREYGHFCIKFSDGSAMTIGLSHGVDISYYTKAANLTSGAINGKNKFPFNFRKPGTKGNKNMVEPYTYGWDGTKEHLLSHPSYGCGTSTSGGYCTKLIQMNGWKIPKNYPIKF